MDNSVIIRNTLFINAGAGTGKTYRLTHDLADFLTGSNTNNHNEKCIKIDPQEVIVTTFSKAAAAEIKERARQVLLDQGRTADATQLETARIGTIHSVAQQFINKYWYLIGSCPNQDVLSDEDKTIYRNQSLATFLDDGKKYARQRDAINAFYRIFRPQKFVNNYFHPFPDFWAEDVEKIVQKVSYYKIADLTESKKASQAEIDELFGNIGDQELQALKACVDAVFDIAEAWMKDYELYKRQIGVIDYDDMEKGFYRLLTDDSCKDVIADEIRSRYKLVMVDEFQDCNPIQLQIFSKISEIISGNSYLPYSSIWVGDPNQAIYGFRGSDTQLINRVKSKFTAEYPHKTSEDNDKYKGLSKDSLDTSYRSREELVNYANKLFNKSICLDGVEKKFFDEYTELKADRKSDKRQGNPVIQWNFQRNGKSKQDKHDSLVSFVRNIKTTVEAHKYQIVPKDEKELRDLRYGDIAILAYSHAEISEIVALLRDEGIPASAPESSILDRSEVQLVLAILNLRHMVEEGGKKISVLRPHEFATILKLWFNKSTEDVISERVDNIISQKDSWTETYPDIKPIIVALDDCKDLPLDEKISAIILELDIYDKVKKWGEEDVRRQNLNTLQNVATQFVSRCSRMGIRATEKEFGKYLKSVEIKSEVDRTSDSVIVSTYHGSKGLEWPMVILYSLNRDPWKNFSQREFYGVHEVQHGNSEDIISNYYIHYVPNIGNYDTSPSVSSLESTEICKNAERRINGELKRLFYVGLTRARDYVVYYCSPKKAEGDKIIWNQDFMWLDTNGIKEEDLNVCAEVYPPLIPKKPTDPYSKAKKPRQKTIEAYREALAEYEKAVAEEEKRSQDKKSPKPYTLHDISELTANDMRAKYRHPSIDSEKEAESDKQDYALEIIPGIARDFISLNDKDGNDIMKYRHASFGSCIHNIYASCPWKGEDLTDVEMNDYVNSAENIVGNYHLEDIITDVKPLIQNLLCLYRWLKSKYGDPKEIVHEYPFSYSYGDDGKQIVTGEIDLVYCTEDTDIIIDYKTHIGDENSLSNSIGEGKYKIDFVSSKYVPQLSIYKNIWKRAYPKKQVMTYLYYNVLGGIVELRNE